MEVVHVCQWMSRKMCYLNKYFAQVLHILVYSQCLKILYWQVSRFLNNIILIISKAVWQQLYPLSSAMRLWAWHHLLQPPMTPSTLVTASDFLFSMLTADLATVKSYCWKNIEGTQPSQSKSYFQDLSLLRQAGFPCCHGNGKDVERKGS